jgi:hypothetical protein
LEKREGSLGVYFRDERGWRSRNVEYDIQRENY